jgi:hypothetical protein
MSAILSLKVSPGEPVRRGSAHFWSVIRDLTAADRKASFGITDIRIRCDGVEASTIHGFLRLATKVGFLVETISGDRWTTRWSVIKRPTRLPHITADGRVVGSGTEAMWNAMRALGSFTAPELSVAASTEETPVAPETAKSYTALLARAGYLKVERAGNPRRPSLYRLKPSMNTGPEAPAILRTKLVFDRNRNEIIGRVVAEEVAP